MPLNITAAIRRVDTPDTPLGEVQRLIYDRMRECTLTELAEQSGISRAMFSAMLTGSAGPGRDTLALLLAWDRAFEVPVWDYLVEHGSYLRSLRKEPAAA